jgi:hypothetical protein
MWILYGLALAVVSRARLAARERALEGAHGGGADARDADARDAARVDAATEPSA